VVLVTFDTTRADHLGCYGNDTVDTPTVDALAAEGVRFERALSAIPITLPSHSTILTGKYPPGHGVRDNGLFVLAEEQETLAEILKGHGYATGAAVGAFPLVARFGVDQGFDHFDDRLSSEGLGVLGAGALAAPRLFFEERRAARVNEAVFDWLEAVSADPFFLWVHYYDPHQPHEPPPPYDQLYANDRYDGEIAYADESLGVLLDRLRSLGVYDRTLVVFTSDHGEGLGEHGELTHSYLVYDTTLHVPLIFRLPGGAGGGRVVAEPVRLVDLLPTILDLLELPVPDGLDGRSLETALEGGATSPRPHYAESLSARFNHNWGELRALYDGGWKYIHGPRPELYDLGADPRELHDLAGAEPEVAERMRSALAGFLARRAAASASVASVPDAETRERLQALGYLQGGGGEPATVSEELRGDGTPPQDRIGDVSAMSQVRSLLVQGRAFAAQQIAEELIRRDPVNPFYLEVLANTQLQLGQVDGARETIERLGELGPLRDPGRLLALRLGHALYLRGAREEGLARVRRITCWRCFSATSGTPGRKRRSAEPSSSTPPTPRPGSTWRSASTRGATRTPPASTSAAPSPTSPTTPPSTSTTGRS
jgi:arylsulfatase A-like enzyme